MSHACGVGERVSADIVRMMLLLKIQSLSYGNSGVQLATVQRLVDFFNADTLPVVYSQGSLGASGDLAPLANMCLPLLGLGEVLYNGEIAPAADVLAIKGWKPLTLKSKEGLALLNGTQFMSAHGTWAIYRSFRIFNASLRVAAMSLEAFDGRIEPFGKEVNEVRHHPDRLKWQPRYAPFSKAAALSLATRSMYKTPTLSAAFLRCTVPCSIHSTTSVP